MLNYYGRFLQIYLFIQINENLFIFAAMVHQLLVGITTQSSELEMFLVKNFDQLANIFVDYKSQRTQR